MRTVGLFAGVAGIEVGFARAGLEPVLFCESDAGAKAVLRSRYPDVSLVGDIRGLKSLPPHISVVAAGFPCQDLSLTGRNRGIRGAQSSLVDNVFRLLKRHDVPNVVIENVPFMLRLNGGEGIRYLVDRFEALGYSWAYRVVDALAFGLPQRRERVFLLASKEGHPRDVLFKGNRQPKILTNHREYANGFYWTEGTRGLGWAVNAVPTIKGGSRLGIPSPPAIWFVDGRIAMPSIRDAERLQGLPMNWTVPAEELVRPGFRWSLVGNAVAPVVSEWIARRVVELKTAPLASVKAVDLDEDRWPNAAFGSRREGRAGVDSSTWPCARRRPMLADFLVDQTKELSLKAVNGFLSRLTASSLKYPPDFLTALLAHRERMQSLAKLRARPGFQAADA